MKYSQELANDIIRRIKAKGAPKVCENCGHNSWSLGEGFTFVAIQEQFPGIVLGGKGMPCITLVCLNCGNVRFINLLTLGFDELRDAEKPKDAQS